MKVFKCCLADKRLEHLDVSAMRIEEGSKLCGWVRKQGKRVALVGGRLECFRVGMPKESSEMLLFIVSD